VRRRRITVVVAAWLVVAASWIAYRRSSDLGTTEAAQQLVDAAAGAWWAVLAFVVLSVLRPFVLVPATLLTVAAGLLFGPWWGIAVAAVGANASAMVGYGVGGSFTADVERAGRLAPWRHRLRANSFESVLLMRLLFLPYDLVNYTAGFLRIRWQPFLAATAIGSLPGTASFVLLGASLTRLDEGVGGIDRTTLAISVLLIVASLAVSRILRRRQPGGQLVAEGVTE
jgi:uncharacterized membrane protein YdjX (TVP38/TMEM64 family)